MSSAIHQMWAYNDWANRRVLDSLSEIGPDLPYACLHLMSHIVNAEVIWSSRMKGIPAPFGTWDDHSLEECKKLHEQSSAWLRDCVNTNLEGFTHTIKYTNSAGMNYQNDLQDILLQTFNHATYHRAQIAQELRRAGFNPPLTDYIQFVRD